MVGCGYEEACVELHKAMEEVEQQRRAGREVRSPVAMVIEKMR